MCFVNKNGSERQFGKNAIICSLSAFSVHMFVSSWINKFFYEAFIGVLLCYGHKWFGRRGRKLLIYSSGSYWHETFPINWLVAHWILWWKIIDDKCPSVFQETFKRFVWKITHNPYQGSVMFHLILSCFLTRLFRVVFKISLLGNSNDKKNLKALHS